MLTFLDVVVAIRTRAPFQVWVEIHIDVLLKLEVLDKDLLRAKFPDIILGKLLLASCLSAFYLHYLSISDIVLKVIVKTVETEFVLTFYAIHILFFIVHITYRA